MITRYYKIRIGMVWVRSGHILKFRYKKFEHDPEPTVICLYALKGTHPNTGHRWNLLECINLNYIPRTFRKQFCNIWIKILDEYKGNTIFTWEIVKRRYPFMVIACRRYLLDGRNITEIKEIPIEDIHNVVVSTWFKDYSRNIMYDMLARFKGAKPMKKVGTNPFSGWNAFSGSKIFGRGKK